MQILVDPQGALPTNYVVDLFFPKIKVPAATSIFSKARLTALKYTQSTSKLQTVMEMLLTEYFFYTYADAHADDTPAFTPSFNPHVVGSPSTVSFPVRNPSAFTVDPNTKDRFIIQTETPEMIIEQPYNPANPTLLTTATNANVFIYTLAKWVEFVPTTQLAASATHTLAFQSFKNMPYQIPSGMDFQVRQLAGIIGMANSKWGMANGKWQMGDASADNY